MQCALRGGTSRPTGATRCAMPCDGSRSAPGVRCSSALSVAGAVALGSHNPTDPSLSTAAGGPPANWLGSGGAYFSDALLLLFGLGSALFMPVVALAGLRMLRLQPAGRIGRSLAARRDRRRPHRSRIEPHQRIGGIRPARGMGRSARARRRARSRRSDRIDPQPIDCGTDAPRPRCCCSRSAASRSGYVALGLNSDEKGWLGGLLRRQPARAAGRSAPHRDRRRARDSRCSAEVATRRRGRRTGATGCARRPRTNAQARGAAEPRAR